MTLINTILEARLSQRQHEGLLRILSPFKKSLIDLTSNDYFGFAHSNDLSAIENITEVGSTGSRLLTGNCPFYEELEQKIAGFHRAESCLIFNSGYVANLGLLSAIGTEGVTFVYDLEVHASTIDGMRLSQAKSVPFRHNDLNSLEQRLKKMALPAFVVIESIYSISGSYAPIREIVALCQQYGAALIVDEAHATGIHGPNGEGIVVEKELELHVFARMHTFSKALGVQGACVVGSKMLKNYLINFSRPLIYSTALPLSTLILIDRAYSKLIIEAKMLQKKLNENIEYFRTKNGIKELSGPIHPIYISDSRKTKDLAFHLREQGIDVRALLPPTVKRGKECLRVVLHSFNKKSDIDRLFEVM